MNDTNGRFVVLIAGNRIDVALLAARTNRHDTGFVWAGSDEEVLALVKVLPFNLIVLPADHTVFRLIDGIKNTAVNRATPLIALMSPEQANRQAQFNDAGIDDYLEEQAPESENQVLRLIGDWKNKNMAALNYIRIVEKKTKNNPRLTVTIFNKLFEELPRQIEIIKEALNRQHYALAEEFTHKLHGSVSFCALEDMRAPAWALENCLIDKNYPAVDGCFRSLQQSTLNFISLRRSILANLESRDLS